jgi:hypothetical protein
MCILGSCGFKTQNNLYPISQNTIPELARKAYDSIEDKNTFFKLCQMLNDSISNRTGHFFRLRGSTLMITYTDKTIHEINWDFIEETDVIPHIHERLVFYVCIKDSTILVQNKQAEIKELEEKVKKYFFEPDSLDRNIVLRKEYIDSIGVVEVPNALIFLSINAKGNSVSLNEWLLFFKCLHELVDIFENERDRLSIELTGKKFQSLTFEQKELLANISGGYPFILIFDRICE